MRHLVFAIVLFVSSCVQSSVLPDGGVDFSPSSSVVVGEPVSVGWLSGSQTYQTYARYDFVDEQPVAASLTYPVVLNLTAPGKVVVQARLAFAMNTAAFPGCSVDWYGDWVLSDVPGVGACVPRMESLQVLDQNHDIRYTESTKNYDAGAHGIFDVISPSFSYPAGKSTLYIRILGQGTMSTDPKISVQLQ